MSVEDYRKRAWKPAGSRPHIVIATPQLAETQSAYLALADQWWAREQPAAGPTREQALPAVEAEYLHIALARPNIPSSDVSPAQWDSLEADLTARLSGLEPSRPLTINRPRSGPHSVEAFVDRSPGLDALAAHARASLRGVFGDKAVREPPMARGPWRPHVRIAYATTDFDDLRLDGESLDGGVLTGLLTTDLDAFLNPLQALHVQEIAIVDNDAFPHNGGGPCWDADTVRTIPLR
ncbi:2'-5' RNA ligase family protein [Allokutzneria sp. A3M-2-11 16]|uniref:2'-5' RNA ligase family protein n=1 Tax=Allokutzneria sp. A3M-2-11 16 TaxID=2962043 RepID=UPI0020B8D9AC|nr:2'-5' RNA ligase family protein [Allokutzneria sp. A3M-2-11 16]MCP3803349.1 2'-5' RNA ligase family protein [Allokutzneria sp. A3M-2-11 16]